MNFLKSHFDLTRSQRNGILFLVFVLVASLVYQYVWMIPNAEKTKFAFAEEDKLALQKEIDSLKAVEAETSQPRIYPFNPNYLKDYRAYQLGMSVAEFDRLQQFRNQNKWVNSAADFQEVTQISDSLLHVLQPYFKFPDWVVQKEKIKAEIEANAKAKARASKTFEQKQNLNEATEAQLREIVGIGEVLAKRILRYRTKIGGFIDDIQLKDIYGLKYDVQEKLLEEYTVKLEKPHVKLDINQSSVVELAEIPYFDYELSREIVDFIKVREGISDFEELAKIYDFPMHKIDRIKLYLKIND